MLPEQLVELLNYVYKNNQFGNMEMPERNRRSVKYTDICFDSRDGKVWSIGFRGGEEDKHFRVEKKGDIAPIYQWLDEPMGYK